MINTRLILALALVTAVACADRAELTAPRLQNVSMDVSETNLESAALDDAIARIIPSLADEQKGPQLARAFDELSLALSTDHLSVGGRLSNARAALENYEAAGGEAAELTALNLALESVALRAGRRP